jgi:hypothetical protein
VLGSATTEDERFTPLICPYCGLEGRSPNELLVVMCPACESTIDLRPAPPPWTTVWDHPVRPEITVLPDPSHLQWGLGGAGLFVAAIGMVFVGGGANLALLVAAPVAMVGLMLVGFWGARPAYDD